MKISLNWLKTYIDISHSPEALGEILTDIGLEVEGIDHIESVPGGLKGLVIGEVTECAQHPNADRLSLTRVDVGNEDNLQIICGAPNVAVGQKVVVAKPGTTLFPTEGGQFEIKIAKVRGLESHGMICAEDEIGLGSEHEGIMVLDPEAVVGSLASDYFNIEQDYVFDIGLTPNRSDATSHIGVAEDLAAYLKVNEGHSGTIHYPDTILFKVDNHDLEINVTVENAEACPRYTGVSIKGVNIGESPEWLKTRLRSVDVRPINNIVDATNFVLHEMGQPLHSFDADHIAGKHVIVKTLADGATFASLDGNERVLADEDLMICDGDSKGMCIAGVFGGIGSGVTESTTNVFLESAHFHPVWIRKTSTRHLLRTDAARCFEKTTDPNVCVAALKRAASLIRDLAGGQIASEVIDIYPKKIEPRKVHLSYNHIDRLIGIQMDREKIQEILDAMRIRIVNETDEKLVVAVPTNKADVTREADVIEEILRIYGFNNVPLKPKMENTISYVDRPSHYQVRQILGSFLSSIGFSEMMALSMNPSEYYNERMAIPDGKELVYINNTSNISLDVMRAEMLSSALDAVVYNQNRQSSDIKLFEFGKSYLRNEDQYIEREHITLVIAGSQVPENWLANKGKPATFFSIKKFVDALITRVGIRGYRIENLKDDSDFDYGRMYRMGPDVLVRYGKVSNAILSGFNIRGEVYFADFNFEMLYQFFKRGTISVQEISRYPTVRRDLALLLDKNVGFEEVVKVARQTERNILQLVDLFDVYENEEQLGAGKKSYAVKFIFENMERTLTDAEVDQVMDKLMKAYQSKLGAELR